MISQIACAAYDTLECWVLYRQVKLYSGTKPLKSIADLTLDEWSYLHHDYSDESLIYYDVIVSNYP